MDQPTCYKNSVKPTSIYLILTNRPNYFHHNDVFKTGLSDFDMMVIREFKMGFQKSNIILCLTVIINTLMTKNFDLTINVVPQRIIYNASKKQFFAVLTSMLLLKETMTLLIRLPSWQKRRATWSYHEEIQVTE